MDYTFWIELVLFAILMALSAFFSSSETALFSLSSVQLEQMRRKGHPRVGLIEGLLTRPRRLIMTILIGNELANVAASVISATIIIRLMGAGSEWLNLLVMVPILLLVGEVTPKTLAIRNNIAFAAFECRPIEFFALIVKPLRWMIRTIADVSITFIIGKERSRGNIVTEDMVRVLAHDAVGEGALDRTEAQFIDHIFDFGNKTLEDVMTPRSDIFFLPLKSSIYEKVEELRRTRHTKVPIYREHRDNIVGILYARDLLGADLEKLSAESQEFIDLLREPYFVPESKQAAELFNTFRERRMSCALTVDEYGGVTGLVTMEDLLECIFGDIHSPSDISPHEYIKELEKGRYRIDGAMPISDLNERINSNLDEESAETIGGLLLNEYGELPSEGTVIVINSLKFKVVEVEENRVKELHLELEDTETAVSETKE
ncbi:MAG: hemolysin family protein [Desulfobacterales bacterium]|nr:hemolysin family protein [Desulfobacterales bacterium]